MLTNHTYVTLQSLTSYLQQNPRIYRTKPLSYPRYLQQNPRIHRTKPLSYPRYLQQNPRTHRTHDICKKGIFKITVRDPP